MAPSDAAMSGSYDYLQAALSVLIGISASYTALDLAGRVTAASGWARKAWLMGGAIAMGIGIWSMHYVGMRAFRLPGGQHPHSGHLYYGPWRYSHVSASHEADDF
jgi:NO-binding membrane sensor protein with MHYT domain